MTVVYANYAAALINSKNSSVVGRVGAAVIPGQKPLLGGGIVGISKYSQKVDACKQFFHWYYSTDVASLLVRLGGTSPIVDAYEDFQNYSVFPWMNTSKKSFGLGQRGIKENAPEGFSIQRYEFAIRTAVRNVLQGIINIPGTWFGWWSDEAFVLYLIVDTILVMLYCAIWIICFKKNSVFRALALSIIPSMLFLFSGIMSRSVLLIIASVLFAPSHIVTSYRNAK